MVLDIAVGVVMLLLMVLGFVRGFVKEVFGIAGLVAAVGVTVLQHDYFFDVFSERVQSETLAGIFSGIAVFVGSMVSAILINGIIMRLLVPLRHSVLDKAAGSIVGLAKGLVMSYFLFFVIETFLYVFAPYPEERSDEKRIELPNWFVATYSYNVFSVASEYMGGTISDETYDKVTVVIHELLDKKRSSRSQALRGNDDEI